MAGARKPNEVDLIVGANIRRLRGQHGLTLQEFASRLDLSHQQLHKYETGVNRVSAGVLHPLALAFGVPVEALFEGADDKTGLDARSGTLHRARSKCHAIVDRVTSVPVLDSMAKVLHALQDKD